MYKIRKNMLLFLSTLVYTSFYEIIRANQ